MRMILFAILIVPLVANAGHKLNKPAPTPSCNGVVEDKADLLTNPPTIAQLNKYYAKYCSQAKYEENKQGTKKLMKQLIGIIHSGAYLNEISWDQNNALFYSNCCD